MLAGRTFGPALAVAEFRWLWVADTQSQIGDQLSRVALSALVYYRTGSGLATAGVYSLTFLPALFGGALLSGLADRIPRRRVLVVAAGIRAILLGLMALPGMPLVPIAAMLALSVLIGSVFGAAESALVADILDGDRYPAGVGLRSVTGQLAQLLGFAAGGALVAFLGARGTLALDSATFVVSAILIRCGVRWRPGARSTHGSEDNGLQMLASAGRVFAEPVLRRLLGLAWLAGFLVVPEGLAAPYAHAHGGGPVSLGLLLAAAPAGMALGAVWFLRSFSAERRSRLLGPFAAAAGLPLLMFLANPPIGVAIALLGLSGAFMAYQVQLIADFVPAIPNGLRSQAIGIASSGLLVAQGLGLLAAGALAETTAVANVISMAGLAGTATALYFARALSQGRRSVHMLAVTEPAR